MESAASEKQQPYSRSLSRKTTMSLNYPTSNNLASNNDQNKELFSQPNLHNQKLSLQSSQADGYQPQAIHSPAISMNSQKFGSNHSNQELFFSDEKLLVNWLRTRPDLIIQAQSSLETNVSEPMDKETTINLVMEQCKLLFLRTRNPTKKMRETLIMMIIPSMDSISKEFKMLCKKLVNTLIIFVILLTKIWHHLLKIFLLKNGNFINFFYIYL